MARDGHNGAVTRTTAAWTVGIVPSAAVLAVCRALDVDSDVIAAVLVVPVAVAAALGGARTGVRIGAVVGVAYAVALLAPFGHLRIGVTRDMLVLLLFVALAAVIGWVVDRRTGRTLSSAAPGADAAALLNVVSHDLRNPLSTIRSASSELLSGRHVDGDEHREELLELVVSETERLDRIVGNLLHAGRARAGRIVPDVGPESVWQLVEGAVGRLSQIHRQKLANDVSVDLPAVLVDAVLIDQVIANLVDNAARVSPEVSTIRITADTDAGMVAVSVTDEGPGFELADEDPFEAYVSAGGSSGLGLAICRTIVAAHGGTIDVADASSGACVRFTLPVADV